MMQLLFKQLIKNSFVLTNGELYRLQADNGNSSKPVAHLPKLSILILGRDSCQEVERSYPVIDQNDLAAILKNETSGSWMSSRPEVEGTQTRLKMWLPNEGANQIIRDHWVIWIPETLLLNLGCEEGFYAFTRFAQTLYQVKNEGESVSSIAVGAYKNASYFLLSAGIENVADPEQKDTVAWQQSIKKGLAKIAFQDAIQIFKSQNILNYLRNLFHWPSAIVGAFAGLMLVTLSQLGWQNIQISALESEAASQDVRTIMSLDKRVKSKKELLQSLSREDSSGLESYPMWRLLAYVMENNITVIEFSMQDGKKLFRLQSDSAIDALEMVRALPYVGSAEFNTSVQKSRGKERYTIRLEFSGETH